MILKAIGKIMALHFFHDFWFFEKISDNNI